MFTETVTYNIWNTTSSWLTAHSSQQVSRMYDPLVGRMLSPDIVIQNPEYSQSYNRYSYCFNNPLRFTDLSGYVVRGRNDVLNPQYFIWLKSSNSKNGNSFNTDIVEGLPMMMEDNYTVDEQGYIKLVEKTNDDFDILYTKASWDSGEKDDFIKLDKGILDKGKSIPLEDVEYNKYDVNYYSVNDDVKATDLFEFLANNTNVEWSQTLVGSTDSNNNYISTSHHEKKELYQYFLFVNGWTIRGHNHNHPMNAYPSNNDKKWAQNVTSKFPTATLKIYLNGIYYEYDKFGMSESSIFKYYINY